MSQFPVLKRVIVLIGLDVSARDLHEGQGGPRLLLHWDIIWINFVPAGPSQNTIIANALDNTTNAIQICRCRLVISE